MIFSNLHPIKIKVFLLLAPCGSLRVDLNSPTQHPMRPIQRTCKKLFKEVIANMGANLRDVAMQRTACAVITLHCIRTNFEKASRVPMPIRAQSTQADDDDVFRVAIKRDKILQGRRHMLPTNPLTKLKKESLKAWINKIIEHAAKHQLPQGEGNQSDRDASDGDEN